ncbi:formylglycine-generating enzyme family protein [Microcoleus sp. herbarium8]|uniref:formylglycine-generating enzyme family protein n=1 Tax=Microcoleus sp. herbarium8 TaxID=3055436 RepID=UPI002FD4F7A8
MPNEQNQPGEYDAVKGGQNSTPVNAAVLGGIAGVKSRLASPAIEVRIAALSQALKYGEAGLDLIIGALRDESMSVQSAAYSLLKDRKDLKIQLQFQDYLPTFEFDVITVDSHGRENSRTKSFASFFPEDLGNGIVLEMVYIPAGTFQMGSSESSSEQPVHQVTVQPFYLGKYPITQAQWETVMGNNPSNFKGAKRPVEQVSWDAAVQFCQKLSEKTGKTYRLPSEAEWEYACRARTSTPFYFGDTITPDLVNYDGNNPYGSAPNGLFRRETTDVGSFPPNSFGLYDMHGNVWEWCSGEHHRYSSNILIDNISDEVSSETCIYNERAIRGGSWSNAAFICHSAKSTYISPDIRNHCVGFRVALVSA